MARIVINPTTFENKKDALCVAFNEGFRIWMEQQGFEPQSEPTDKQRRFFSDTAYGDDELMLRRTILARIATFDTSVTDPTDEQLQETVQMLQGVIESGYPKNDWELNCVNRLIKAVSAAAGSPMEPAEEPLEPEARPIEPSVRGAVGGGETDKKNLPQDSKELLDRVEESGKRMDAAVDAFMQKTNEGVDTAQQDAEAVVPVQTQGERSQDGVTEDGFIIGAAVPTDVPTAPAAPTVPASPPEVQTPEGGQSQQAETQTQSEGKGSTASSRIGMTSGVFGAGGRELTAGEAAWQARREASTTAWRQRTGRGGIYIADASLAAPSEDTSATVGTTASSRIGQTSDMTGIGGRKLTAGEAAWQRKRNQKA